MRLNSITLICGLLLLSIGNVSTGQTWQALPPYGEIAPPIKKGIEEKAPVNMKSIPIMEKPPVMPLQSRTVFVAVDGSDGSGTGSYEKPWASIQFALDSVRAGSLIVVRQGVYAQKIRFSGMMNSGTLERPIKIKASGAVLDGSNLSPSGDTGIITIDNASHILISGIEIKNYKTVVEFSTGASPAGVIIRGGGTDIELRGLKIHGIEDNATCTQNDNNCDSGANGIGVYGSTPEGLKDIRLINNEVYDNVLGASEALTINGNVDGFIVEGNYVHDNNNIGFDFIGGEGDVCVACSSVQNRARNGLVRRNKAENNSIIHFGANPWYAGEDGNAAGFYVDGGHHILMEQNISTGNDLGLEIASENPGFGSDDIIASSNFLYNNFELGIAMGGYAQSAGGAGGGSANRLHIINNTLYHNSGHSSEITMNYRVHDMRFVNNIVFGETSIDETYEIPNSNTQMSNLVWENNLWWASATIDAVPVNDSAAVVSNPQFENISAGSAVLAAGSLAVNAGQAEIDISTWTDAFWLKSFPNGNIPVHGTHAAGHRPRVAGLIDIGAAEQ